MYIYMYISSYSDYNLIYYMLAIYIYMYITLDYYIFFTPIHSWNFTIHT